MRMTRLHWRVAALVAQVAACGTEPVTPDDGQVADAGPDGATVDGGPDAAPPPFVRVLHTVTAGTSTALYAADVDDGAVGDAVPLSLPVTNPTSSVTAVSTGAGGRVV